MAVHYKVREFEYFPVYDVEKSQTPTGLGREAVFTEEEFADYTRVSEEYQAWQDRLEVLYNGRPRRPFS